jgi:hypothetical protein
VAQRVALGEALSGRRVAGELELLARLLLDTDLSVRRVAGVALQRTLGAQVSYDPQWEAPRRQQAVDRLRGSLRSN